MFWVWVVVNYGCGWRLMSVKERNMGFFTSGWTELMAQTVDAKMVSFFVLTVFTKSFS